MNTTKNTTSLRINLRDSYPADLRKHREEGSYPPDLRKQLQDSIPRNRAREVHDAACTACKAAWEAYKSANAIKDAALEAYYDAVAAKDAAWEAFKE